MAKKKLVSLKEAIDVLNDAFQNNPEKSGRDAISKGTLYNAISSKRLTAHGSSHFRQVEVEELLREFGPKKDKSA